MGGMGEVFLAEQVTPFFTRQVAIKRALPHVAAERGFAERLIDEARLMTRLHHGNIIHVHELRQEEGELYMVMEYLPGLDVRSLNQRIRDRGERWSAELAVYVVHEVCLGLDYAHKAQDEAGVHLDVIHRDLSPSNILLGRDGEVKLIDFGVARARGGIHQSVAGSLQGKLAYVSPEQARGEPLTCKTDLFSLGVTLFEMLSGVRPLDADHDVELLRLAQQGSYYKLSQLSEERPELALDPELCLIVDQAMALAPDQRFDSAGHFAQSLRTWLDRVSPVRRAEVDRLALKRWLTPLLAEHERGEDTLDPAPHATAQDPFSEALAELIMSGDQGPLPERRGAGGGVTVTLSVDVQAQVNELEALPESEDLELALAYVGDEAPSARSEQASPDPVSHVAQLSRARYTALIVLLVSVAVLLFSLKGSSSSLVVGVERGSLRSLGVERVTVDGEDWLEVAQHDERAPIEVCVWRQARSTCQWVTLLDLRFYNEMSSEDQATVELWGGALPVEQARVVYFDAQLLSALSPSVTSVDEDEYGLPFPTRRRDPEATAGQGGTQAQPDREKAQSDKTKTLPKSDLGLPTHDAQGDDEDQLIEPRMPARAEKPRSLKELDDQQRRAELRARRRSADEVYTPSWYTFEVTPKEGSALRCTPPHAEDQALRVRARPHLRCQITAPGYETQQVTLSDQGSDRITIKLTQLARLNVRVIPATATLRLDGERVENPLRRYPLKPGEHSLVGEFEHQGERWTERRTFQVAEGERRSVVIELKPPR